jgi:hypothetical protein
MSTTTFNPQIVYNAGATTVSLTLPMRLWDPTSRGVGGQNVSTAGIPEAFELRRDELVKVTLRFKETEWPNIRTFLVFQQRNPSSSFTFNFQTSPLVAAPSAVYLEKPAMAEDISPKRGDAKGTFEIDLVLRSVNSTSLHVQAF